MVETDYEEGCFTGKDGLRLQARWWLPRRTIQGAFLILHGFGEYSSRYQNLVQNLSDFPFLFATFDLRGHGDSEGDRVYVEQFSDFANDLFEFFLFLEKRFPFALRRTFLFGHSMGGLLAAFSAMKNLFPVKALLLSSPCFSIRLWLPFGKSIIPPLGNLLPHWVIENPVRPMFLTHDPLEANHYRWDPLIQRRITLRLLREMLVTGKMVVARAGEIGVPTYVLMAAEDLIVDKKASQEFYKRLGSQQKRCFELDGFYHEIFNEVNRSRSFEKLKEFIREAEKC